MAPTSPRPSCSLVVTVGALLLSGASTNILLKAMYSTWVGGADGSRDRFSRPNFTVFLMFNAMALVGLVDAVARIIVNTNECKDAKVVRLPLPDSPSTECNDVPRSLLTFLKQVSILGLPAVCDLCAATLMHTSLTLIPASWTVMLTGADIFFTTSLSVLLLRRRISPRQWLGTVICMAGATLIGRSGLLRSRLSPEPHASSQASLGVVLILGATALWSVQGVSGEFFMKDMRLPAMQVVVWQGFWGLVAMCVWHSAMCLDPLTGGGQIAELKNTIAMLAMSPSLVLMSVLYLLAAAVYNASSFRVISELSSVQASMIESMTMVVVWTFDIFVHYFVNASLDLGEAWHPRSDSLKLFGFMALVLGQVMYAAMLEEDEEDAEAAPCHMTEAAKKRRMDLRRRR